jgi:ABC-2 type transport system permease protein
MAVYEQTYRRYQGPETPHALRFLVIPRYAYQRLSGSKVWWVLLAASGLTTLVYAVLIYLRHNTRALAVFGATPEEFAKILPVEGSFFATFLGIQFFLGFLVVLLIGPPLISMDLANGALPLYLARPVNRFEYAAGKFVVLGAALSLLTWVFGLGLFGLQATLEGGGWLTDHLRLGAALFVGSWVWIVVLSLLTLALSALIRWPLAVRGVLLSLFLLLPGFGHAIYQGMGKRWGLLLDPGAVFEGMVRGLFGLPPGQTPPLAGVWAVLIGVVLVSTAILARRLRAYEVVS